MYTYYYLIISTFQVEELLTFTLRSLINEWGANIQEEADPLIEIVIDFPNACFECVKFIYSEKATEFCEIFTLLLSYVLSEYINFICK